MVIIAVPTFENGGINDKLNPRFGRCESFTFVTLEGNEIQEVRVVKNNAMNAMGGAGIKATEIVGNGGATAVIVGFLGPNAVQSLTALRLKIFEAPQKDITVKEAIKLYQENKLSETTSANVDAHFGMGRGGGGGGGFGQGGGRRGMGGSF